MATPTRGVRIDRAHGDGVMGGTSTLVAAGSWMGASRRALLMQPAARAGVLIIDADRVAATSVTGARPGEF